MSGPPRGHQTGLARAVDVRERGAERQGEPQLLDRRLFMQLLVFNSPEVYQSSSTLATLGRALAERKVPCVLYHDLNDPTGIGVLTWSEEPLDFTGKLRMAFEDANQHHLRLRANLTMFGRSYAMGFEPDIEHWLLRRPPETVLNEAWPWAIWYPLRRSGSFEQLEPSERGNMLREHGELGKAYGEAGLAHDVRLACHGLDAADNEFLIGLCGKDLHPLSHLVQAMRKTRHTAEYIAQMGPFFVGRAAFRHAG